jgi:hypothetical protein
MTNTDLRQPDVAMNGESKKAISLTSLDVHRVVTALARKGDWRSATLALLGAHKSGFIPTQSRTAMAALSAVAATGSWQACTVVLRAVLSTGAAVHVQRAAVTLLALNHPIQAYSLYQNLRRVDVWSAAFVAWQLANANKSSAMVAELVDEARLDRLPSSPAFRACVLPHIAQCGRWQSAFRLCAGSSSQGERDANIRHVVHACAQAYSRGGSHGDLWRNALQYFCAEASSASARSPTTTASLAVLLSMSEELWPASLAIANNTELVANTSTSTLATLACASAISKSRSPALAKRYTDQLAKTPAKSLPLEFVALLADAGGWLRNLTTVTSVLTDPTVRIPHSVADTHHLLRLLTTSTRAQSWRDQLHAMVGISMLLQSHSISCVDFAAAAMRRWPRDDASMSLRRWVSHLLEAGIASAELAVEAFRLSRETAVSIEIAERACGVRQLVTQVPRNDDHWLLSLAALCAAHVDEQNALCLKFAESTGRWEQAMATLSGRCHGSTLRGLAAVAVRGRSWAGALALLRAANAPVPPFIAFLGHCQAGRVEDALADAEEQILADPDATSALSNELETVSEQLLLSLSPDDARAAEFVRGIANLPWMSHNMTAATADCRAAGRNGNEATCVKRAFERLDGGPAVRTALVALVAARRVSHAASLAEKSLARLDHICIEDSTGHIARQVLPPIARQLKDEHIKTQVLEVWARYVGGDLPSTSIADVEFVFATAPAKSTWRAAVILAGRRLRGDGPALPNAVAAVLVDALARGRPDPTLWQAASELVSLAATAPNALRADVAGCFAHHGQWEAAASVLSTEARTAKSAAARLLADVNQRLARDAQSVAELLQHVGLLLNGTMEPSEKRRRLASVVQETLTKGDAAAVVAIIDAVGDRRDLLCPSLLLSRCADFVARRSDWMDALRITQIAVDQCADLVRRGKRSATAQDTDANGQIAPATELLLRALQTIAEHGAAARSLHAVCRALVLWEDVVRLPTEAEVVWPGDAPSFTPPYHALLAVMPAGGGDAVPLPREVQSVLRRAADASHDAHIGFLLGHVEPTEVFPRPAMAPTPTSTTAAEATRLSALLCFDAAGRPSLSPQEVRSALGPWRDSRPVENAALTREYLQRRAYEHRFLSSVSDESGVISDQKESVPPNGGTLPATALGDAKMATLEWGARHGGVALAAAALTECRGLNAAQVVAAYIKDRRTLLSHQRAALGYSPRVTVQPSRAGVVPTTIEESLDVSGGTASRGDSAGDQPYWHVALRLMVHQSRRNRNGKPSLTDAMAFLGAGTPWRIALEGFQHVGVGRDAWAAAMALSSHASGQALAVRLTTPGPAPRVQVLATLGSGDAEARLLARAIVAFGAKEEYVTEAHRVLQKK